MSTMRIVGTVLTIGGVIVAVVSALADVIGLGGSPGFGFGQIAGVAVGAIAAVVGVVLLLRKK